MDKYTLLIGLEIHVELSTKSKMFCQCEADYFGKDPNTNTCPVCLGLPGALPVPNKQAIEWTIKIGQALNCKINEISKFDRKHYFYPDLPKGYQISQYDEPIASSGELELKNKKKFRIHRVHLEEDTGKLTHKDNETLVDFNRSSVPLVEIVTEADFDNSDDVKEFLEELQVIIRYLGVSDADMEKGSMRLEPNISVRKPGEKGFPPYKVEVKNINSFKFVKKAIEYEFARQVELLKKGEVPTQETRGFNENKGVTFSQRSKEEAHDYRYFPEPDIPPLVFKKEYIDKVHSSLPELPRDKLKRYTNRLGVKEVDAFVLTRDKRLAEIFENVLEKYTNAIKERGGFIPSNVAQSVANFIVNRKWKENDSNAIFNQYVGSMLPKQTDPRVLDDTIGKVLKENGKAVEEYKKGKENVLMFLVGQVMKELKGQGDPNTIKEKLKEAIS